MSDRKSEILSAMLKVGEDDFTKSGKPQLDALNVFLEKDGHEVATSKERDLYWKEVCENSEEPPEEPAPVKAKKAKTGHSMITITKSSSDPVHLHVFGLGTFSIPVGVPFEIPDGVLEAINDSDVSFEIGGDV